MRYEKAEKRPAHRPAKYPDEEMTSITIRMPVRLKEKLRRIAGPGRAAEWVCAKIEGEQE